MKNWLNKIGIYAAKMIALCSIVLFSACAKDGNPFNLPEPDASQYDRSPKPGVIKILAVGNSFSEDAIENNLYELAKEKGLEIIIGNLYIGGASLDDHKKNLEEKRIAYDYRKINQNGEKKVYSKTSIDLAVEDEHWDYISFQQVSQNSGQLETVQRSLPAVYNFVKARAKNPNVKYVYHQTWAYAQNSDHAGFANYNRNQLTMYEAIVNVAQKVKEIAPIDLIVPAGTAIQTARTSAVEDGFTRDGYHLNPLGRYTAACTWFETLFKQSTVGMNYKPAELSVFEAKIAQNAAHFAILKPNEVTPMTDFLGEGGPLTNPVQIGFGKSDPIAGWNWVGGFTAGTRATLKDNAGKEYGGLAVAITERFTGENATGVAATNTPFNMPSAISSRAYYGNRAAVQSVFVLSGLDKGLTYNLCFFGSRAAVSDNRETKYLVSGTNTGQALLNASANATNTVCVDRISPDANGKISVTVSAGPNNNNADRFYYLNAVKLTSNPN